MCQPSDSHFIHFGYILLIAFEPATRLAQTEIGIKKSLTPLLAPSKDNDTISLLSVAMKTPIRKVGVFDF